MSSQVIFCALLVFIQSVIDNELEVRGSGGVNLRHKA